MIVTFHRDRLAVLRRWRSKYGPHATYRNLAHCFYGAEKLEIVEVICQLAAQGTPSREEQQGM